WTFGSQLQIYYLIALWCLVSTAAMYALTRTPFGRMCVAVRENPERAAFVGYNPQTIRFLAFCFAGLFGGIAGSLAAIDFELANAALFSATQSGMVLLATYIGGAGYFFGPILGAVLVSYLQTMLSDITDIWRLYFGVLFIATVMFAPGGLAHLIMIHRPLIRAGTVWRVIPGYILGLLALLIFVAGFVLAVEMIAHLALKSAEGPTLSVLGIPVDTRKWQSWTAAAAALFIGAACLRLAAAPISSAWDRARTAARSQGMLA
ncbi:MAG TPA: branched-chain amino acid ABC transporter permease, partial [Hyphomicrobiales bacterium]|nr:branched-chain amino acid ABC transporter permease [Hyphomicrobiales bacterium]